MGARQSLKKGQKLSFDLHVHWLLEPKASQGFSFESGEIGELPGSTCIVFAEFAICSPLYTLLSVVLCIPSILKLEVNYHLNQSIPFLLYGSFNN